jgi:luciferase family oxidoreductase group 1
MHTDARQPTRPDVPFQLGVLDQSPIAEGSTGAEALLNTLDLARLADDLGYHRYWVAEHHGTPALACAAPEVLIASIAGVTSPRLRVGSGGVMLPHYSPVKVAEQFSMLAGLHPGRIDLGLGRAPGTDPQAAFALQRDRRQRAPTGDFPEQLDELLAYLRNEMPADHPFARLAQLPGRPHAPAPWLLGSSEDSAYWAAERGLPYAFADFINPTGAALAAQYRARFTPSPHDPHPRVAVAGWAVCADTDAEAERLASSFRMLMTLMHRGQLIPVPPPETALRFLAGEPAGNGLNARAMNRRLIVGSPGVVRAGVEALAREYQADEVLLVNILYDHAARRRSYELIAEAFGLGAPTGATTAAASRPRVG